MQSIALAIAGALVALALFWMHPAHGEDVMGGERDGFTARILTIDVLATSPKRPLPHVAYRLSLAYETNFTCTQAGEQLDIELIVKAVQAKFEKKHINVLGAAYKCTDANARI
jgi:hypothetical protein